MKQPIKFVIGNIIKNASLSVKLGEAQRDGYRIIGSNMLEGIHPGVMVVAMQLVEGPFGPPTWRAEYAKRTKTN